MKVHLWGTDFRRSNAEMRTKLFRHPEVREEFLRKSLELGFQDLVYLHTCNRVEFYTTGRDYFSDSRPLWLKLLRSMGLSDEDFYRGYHLEGKSAVRHLMRVASSLESLVVGEPQILGQLKEAVKFTKETGLPIHSPLERTFLLSFETAKKIRATTALGEKSVSVASLGLDHLQNLEKEYPAKRVVVVGRSPISRIVLQWFAKHRPSVGRVWVNRSIAKIRELPESLGAECLSLESFLSAPGDFSHMVTATSSREAIFDEAFFKRLGSGQKMIFDFAEPADVASLQTPSDSLTLIRMSDLLEEAKRNACLRASAVEAAEAIIEDAIKGFCHEQKQAPIMRDFTSVEPRFIEEFLLAWSLVESEVPPELQPKIKKWAEKLVKRNLHCSREHLRELLKKISEPDQGFGVL